MATLQPVRKLFSVYKMDLDDLEDLGDLLVTPGFFENVAKWFIDPIDFIRGLKYIPCDELPTQITPTVLYFGGYNTTLPCVELQNVIKTFNMGSLDRGNLSTGSADWFQRFEPYSSYKIYLPYCGWFPLDAGFVYGGNNLNTLHLTCDVNYLTGDVFYRLGGAGREQTFTGNCAVDLPINSVNNTPLIGSAVGVVMGAGAGFVAGGPIGAVAGGAVSAISSIAGGVAPSVTAVGGVNFASGYPGEQVPFVLRENAPIYVPINTTPSNITHYYNCNVEAPISIFSGYAEIVNPEFNNADILGDEYSEIVELLANGVFL